MNSIIGSTIKTCTRSYRTPLPDFFSYAVRAKKDIVSSRHIAGTVDPVALGLEKNIRISPDAMELRRSTTLQSVPAEKVNTPTTGVINNTVVFMRFSDEAEFSSSLSPYTSMFNASAAGASSVRNYYFEASYSQLTVISSFYPTTLGSTVVSYQDAHPRAYYQPYNQVTNPAGYTGGDNGSVRQIREHTLLKNAANAISSQVPASLVIDADGDSFVDNAEFIIKGGATGWNSLLWPHRWSLYTYDVRINGKRVYDYNFQLDNITDVGVLCHEMFHSLGAPDLYHYSLDAFHPVGGWDLMEYDAAIPQHMGAYMKFRYGEWLTSIPQITQSGTYVLSPVGSSKSSCYKIASPNASDQYYVVEYRRKLGTFESNLPGEGLLVYRI